MTPERWQQIRDCFDAAVELPAADVAQHLDQACAGDDDLRHEVVALLRAHTTPDGPIDGAVEQLLPSAAFAPGPDPRLGSRVGAYEIVAPLGHGGMGDVYRARRVDAQFEKQVAIKLLRVGLDSQAVVRRFATERQILANLEHPNIAHLLDGGVTDDGEPFFVMELVEGQPIDVYCDTHRVDMDGRVRLFRDVCAAVGFAHQRLVIHRDLKPSNIFVTADGVVKLLDFGIAKLLPSDAAAASAAPDTQTSLRALTPAFSSPEQLLGLEVTTTTDVYSLGVVLFHLLTGRSPYRTTLSSLQDAIEDVCHSEPARPSAVVARSARDGAPRALPDQDLDAIVLRALRKEPARRYASVEQFSEDLRRYLAGVPVVARGDELSYHVGKFLRRHRYATAATGLVIVGLAVALFAVARQARIAEQQRALAVQNFAGVRELANVFMFQVHDAIRDLPGATAAREGLAETTQRYLQMLAAQSANDPGLQLELAESYTRLGDLQGEPNAANLGQSQAALASYGKAIELLNAVAGAQQTQARVLGMLARTHSKRSTLLLMANGDGAGAVRESTLAIDFARRAVAARPMDAEPKRALASILGTNSYQLTFTGDYAAAQTSADQSIAIMEELHRLRPADRDTARALAKAYSDAVGMQPGKMDDAAIERDLRRARRALELDLALNATEPQLKVSHQRAVGVSQNNLGLLLYLRGDYPGALAALQSAEDAIAATLGDAHNDQARLDMARSRINRSRAQLATGDWRTSYEVFATAAADLEALAVRNDAKELQYILAVAEEQLGTIESLRARAATVESDRLRHWRAARGWFARSAPRFERTLAGLTLGAWDQEPVDRAVAGLAASSEALRTLDAPAAR